MKWFLIAAVAALPFATLSTRAAEPAIHQAAYAGNNWWARYGTPPVPQPEAVTPVSAEPAALVDPHGWNGHGYDYIYYPGICDYTPPCVWDLWAGYYPNPLRCHPHYLRCKCPTCNGGGNCGACGAGGSGGCTSCGAAATGSCTSCVAHKKASNSYLCTDSAPVAPKPPADPTAKLGVPRILPISQRR